MNYAWYALICLTFVWTTALHVYEPPSALGALLLLGAAFLLCFLENRKGKEMPGRLCAGNAFLTCLFLLASQGIVFSFYRLLAARVHEESFFAACVSPVLNLFGIRTTAEGSALLLDAYRGTYTVVSTLEKAGMPYLALMLTGGIALLLISNAGKKRMVIFAASLFAFAVFRYAFVLMLCASYYVHSVFWERSLSLITWIPFAIAAGVFFRRQTPPKFDWLFQKSGKRERIIAASLGFFLFFSGMAFFGWHDTGIKKEGRVLVDEYHSDWEWTTEEYDTKWFGQRSGYNYYCFYDFLSKHYETDRNHAEIAKETLEGVSVFIMKTPTLPFTEQEIQVMVDFVKKGGGLYLLGDHTNVFGTGTNLNELSGHFNIKFRYDATYELVRGSLSEYDRPRILAHPVARELPRFLFATSDSLMADWKAEEILLGYGLQSYPADYSQKNFFPEKSDGPDLEFGLFLQCAGVSYGKGRVLAFTDSTVFSNFWMYMPGKPELLLSSVDWLNRENTMAGAGTRQISLMAMLVFLVLTAGAMVRLRKRFSPMALIGGGAIALMAGILLFGTINQQAVQLPEAREPMVRICFEDQYSQMKIPKDLAGFMSEVSEQLNTFYVWTQRLGYYPSLENSLLQALSQGSLAVMAKPAEAIENQKQVLEKIREGGRLLILDNTASGAHANALLGLAGMEIQEAEMGTLADYEEISGIMLTENASRIAGGEGLAFDEKGNAVLAVARVGEGLVAVLSDPDLMYSLHLGDVSANLTPNTEILTNLEFKMLKNLVEME